MKFERPGYLRVVEQAVAWRALHFALVDGAPLTASKVALVVGTILNLINQGDTLFGLRPVVWWKLVLTYCVPYLVCTYGIVSSRLRHEALSRASATALAQHGDARR